MTVILWALDRVRGRALGWLGPGSPKSVSMVEGRAEAWRESFLTLVEREGGFCFCFVFCYDDGSLTGAALNYGGCFLLV